MVIHTTTTSTPISDEIWMTVQAKGEALDKASKVVGVARYIESVLPFITPPLVLYQCIHKNHLIAIIMFVILVAFQIWVTSFNSRRRDLIVDRQLELVWIVRQLMMID